VVYYRRIKKKTTYQASGIEREAGGGERPEGEPKKRKSYSSGILYRTRIVIDFEKEEFPRKLKPRELQDHTH